jgi:hypothetical protein
LAARKPVLTPRQQSAFNNVLQTGIQKKNMEMIKLALDDGAEPNQLLLAGIRFKPRLRDNFNLNYAEDIGLTWIKTAVEAGADVNAGFPDAKGVNWAALHWARVDFREDISRFLIEKGAAVDTPSPGGWTPLMCAVDSGEENLVRFYLGKGADPLAACGEKKDAFPLKGLQESDKFKKSVKNALIMLMMEQAKKRAEPPAPEAPKPDPVALAQDIEVSKPVELKHFEPPKRPKGFSI